jgi:hypothetical protein
MGAIIAWMHACMHPPMYMHRALPWLHICTHTSCVLICILFVRMYIPNLYPLRTYVHEHKQGALEAGSHATNSADDSAKSVPPSCHEL